MVRIGYLGIAIIAVIMAVTIQEATALKCWRCSSSASGGAFCGDPFNGAASTDHQRRWSLVECLRPEQNSNNVVPLNERPVCKKVKQLVNDEYVISRSCYWERIDAHKNDCLNSSTSSYIKTEFCETCSTDECNGDAMNSAGETNIQSTVDKIRFLFNHF